MIEKLKAKIRQIREITERIESDLVSTHTLLYRIENSFKEKVFVKAEGQLQKLREALTGHLQSNFYALKSEILALNSPAFAQFISQIEENQESPNRNLAAEVRERLKEQNLLLSQFSIMQIQGQPNPGNRPKTNFRPQNLSSEDIIRDVLNFLASNSNDRDV